MFYDVEPFRHPTFAKNMFFPTRIITTLNMTVMTVGRPSGWSTCVFWARWLFVRSGLATNWSVFREKEPTHPHSSSILEMNDLLVQLYNTTEINWMCAYCSYILTYLVHLNPEIFYSHRAVAQGHRATALQEMWSISSCQTTTARSSRHVYGRVGGGVLCCAWGTSC